VRRRLELPAALVVRASTGPAATAPNGGAGGR
jgi:hypothetical protein